jgi:peptidoglycan/LPS O-acetylase OafA/YrhL
MTKETSIYLDAVRFAAALIVFLSHFGEKRWSGGLGWQLTRFGAPAVDVFFVLSGYVIAYVVATKEADLRSYAISRAARLYSVCIPVLLLTAVLGFLGRKINPNFDAGDASVRAYLLSVAFTNQLWFINVRPGNNIPYWSLGYEAIYYAIFAAMTYAPKRWRFATTSLCCLIAGPRILIMMPLWLLGAGAYFATRRLKLNESIGAAIWLISTGILAWMAIRAWGQVDQSAEATATFLRPLTEWRPFAIDYVIGLLIAANFAAFQFSSAYFTKLLEPVGGAIRWLAGATFTLYLAHYPIGRFVAQVFPWPVGSTQERVALVVVTVFSVFLLAEYTERRKAPWHHALQLWFGRRNSHVDGGAVAGGDARNTGLSCDTTEQPRTAP